MVAEWNKWVCKVMSLLLASGMAVSKDLNDYEKWNLPLLYPCSLVWCRNGGWFMPEGWTANVCVCMQMLK